MDPKSVVLIVMILHLRWLLNIQADASNVYLNRQPAEVVEGSSMTLDCVTLNNQRGSRATYYRDSQPVLVVQAGDDCTGEWTVDHKNTETICFGNIGIFRLRFNHVTRELNKSTWQCDIDGQGISNRARINVTENKKVLNIPARIEKHPGNWLVAEGKTVTFRCQSSGNPKPKVEWFRGDRRLSSSRYQILDKGSLVIKNVTSDDSGCYRCHVQNKLGKDTAQGCLEVQDKTLIRDRPQDLRLPHGSDATFTCSTGTDLHRRLFVYWLRDGQNIDFENPRVDISGTTLIIRNITTEDAAVYTCRISNGFVNDTATATLEVEVPYGALQFASYYQDHMVLQRGPQHAVVWGHATKIGDTVFVQVSGQAPVTGKVTKDAEDHRMWKVKLPAITDQGPFTVTATSSEGTVTIRDVLFGDVWLCGGQSNMGFQFSKILNHTAELSTALTYTDIRMMKVNRFQSSTAMTEFNQGFATKWTLPTPDAVNAFSAVCWFFGAYLYPDVNHPIGLIESDWGGTPIEAWSSPDALAVCTHRTKRAAPRGNSVLWNPMINPLLGLTIYGAIWYQGEANADRPDLYACQFPAMINDWRKKFHDASLRETSAEFPFGFVQLAGYRESDTIIGGFPPLRWAQTAKLGEVPNKIMENVFMAVAMDLPDYSSPYGSIHPRYKQDISKRLTLAARAVAYNKTVKYQGPFPETFTMDRTSQTLHIVYDHGPIDVKNNHGFEVCCSTSTETCGSRDQWVAAPIQSHNTFGVDLSTSACRRKHAVGLRYAWRESPCDYKQCAIYGRDTPLPAPPYIHTNGLPTVIIPATIEKPPERVLKAAVGQTVTITCESSGIPKPRVDWFKDSQKLAGPRYQILDKGSLVIKGSEGLSNVMFAAATGNVIDYTFGLWSGAGAGVGFTGGTEDCLDMDVTANDFGNYRCNAQNKHGEDTAQGSLVVRERTVILGGPVDLRQTHGSDATFTCSAVTDPHEWLYYHWLRDGQRIDGNNPRVDVMDATLTIRNITNQDTADYTCVASNGLDNDTFTAKLEVEAPPDPPYDVTLVTCYFESAEVQWKFTTTQENLLPVQNFIVEYNTSFSPEEWIIANRPPANHRRTDVRLSRWTTYNFRVKAVNSIGVSKPSEITKSVCMTPQGRPDRHPRKVKTVGDKTKFLVIEWEVSPTYIKKQRVSDGWIPFRMLWILTQNTLLCPMLHIEHNAPDFFYNITVKEKDGDMVMNFVERDYTVGTKEIFVNTIYKPYEITVQAQNIIGLPIVKAKTVDGFSGEAVPMSVVKNFELDPEINVTATSAGFRWDPVDTSAEAMQGEFKGYKVRFWKASQMETTMREVLVPNVKQKQGQHPDGKVKAELQTIPSFSTLEADVVAINNYFSSSGSNIVRFTSPEGALAQPEIDEVMSTDTSVNVSWTLPDVKGQRVGAQFFLEYRNIGDSDWKRVFEEKKVNFWQQIEGLQTASTYQVRVIATDGQAGNLNYRQIASEVRTFTTTGVDASGVPPKIKTVSRRNVYFIRDEDFTLECVAEGNPDPVYHWMKNGQRLDLSAFEIKGRVSMLSKDGSLRITKANRVDAGIYQCVAENQYGKSLSDHYNVQKSNLDPFLASDPKILRTQVGKPSVLGCIAPTNTPLAKLYWTIKSPDDDNDYGYDEDQDFNLLGLDDRLTMDWNGNLYITNTRLSDEFAYSCVASNPILRAIAVDTTTHLKPYGKPTETRVALMWSSPSHVIGLLKEDIKFKCIFSGNPQPTIVWKRLGQGLDKSRMNKSGDSFEFEIHSLRYKDTGNYVCEGSQPLGDTVQVSFNLKVQSKPEWVKEPEDITVGTGKNAVFSCAAKGRPKPIIKWYINGNPIESEPANPRRRLKGNKLKFINLTRSDSQVIQCNATNKHGYLWADVFLNVQGTVKPTAPPRPTIVNIMAKVKSVNVKWYRPESKGARVTAIYFVEYQKLGEKEWQRVPETETEHWQKIEDLEAGTFYKVRVVAAAASSNGTFIAGNVVAFRTMGMPAIKNITTASTSANVTWDIPHYKDSGIQANVFLEYRKVAESRWERTPEIGDEKCWQLILGLEAASSYEVRVVAAGIEDSDITSDVVVFSIMAPPTQTPVVVEQPDELSCVEESLVDTVCSLKEKVKDLERELRMLYDVVADEREARRRLEDNVHDVMVSRFQ